MWSIEVRRRDTLSDAVLAEQRELGLRSWAASAETTERYPFKIRWATPTWLALVRDTDGRLIGRAGVLVRTVTWAGNDREIGGVSSVSTDPDWWGRGVATASMTRITQFLCEDLRAPVGLLFASQMGRPVYARLGWREVTNRVVCTQPAGDLVWNDEFPSVGAMAWTCDGRDFAEGDINLNGLPW
jgi:GNAT superfamily N-acetyltransferase